MHDLPCYCGSGVSFLECCQPFISKTKLPDSAQKLMRSRYSAYAIGDAQYLLDTTHPSQRKYHNKKDILEWSLENTWLKLEILQAKGNYVSFNAYFRDKLGVEHVHYENSYFEKFASKWYYVNG